MTSSDHSAIAYLVDGLKKQDHEVSIIESQCYRSLTPNIRTFQIGFSPDYERCEYIERLNRIVEENHIDVLMPTGEESKAVCERIDSINCKSILSTDSFVDFKMMSNKILFCKFINEIELENTVSPPIVADNNFIDNKKYILKDAFSVGGYKSYEIGLGSEFKVRDIVAPSFAQEYIENGEEFFIAGCAYKDSFDFVVYSGTSAITSRLDRHKDIEITMRSTIKKMLDFCRYQGFFGIDFIRKNDINYFLECNTRVTFGSACLNFLIDRKFIKIEKNDNDKLYSPVIEAINSGIVRALFIPRKYSVHGVRCSFIEPILWNLSCFLNGITPLISHEYGILRSDKNVFLFKEKIPEAKIQLLSIQDKTLYENIISSADHDKKIQRLVFIIIDTVLYYFVQSISSRKIVFPCHMNKNTVSFKDIVHIEVLCKILADKSGKTPVLWENISESSELSAFLKYKPESIMLVQKNLVYYIKKIFLFFK